MKISHDRTIDHIEASLNFNEASIWSKVYTGLCISSVCNTKVKGRIHMG